MKHVVELYVVLSLVEHLFEFELFPTNLSIKRSKDNVWVKVKETDQNEFVLYGKDKLFWRLEDKLISA